MAGRLDDGTPEPKDYCAAARRYAQRVVAGDIKACESVRLACQRQINDLKPENQGRWHFQEWRGNRVCKFIEQLPHIKGRWKRETIELEDWQCFILTTVFGWVDEEGFRRFKTALIVIPRKNGKTILAAGIALFMLCKDGEPGAEVYSAAITRDQAKLCWDVAKNMIRRAGDMAEHFGLQPLAHSITLEEEASFFMPLGRDADSLEGKNPQCAVIDELHAHKTREVWDVLNVARAARRQSLLFAITTAGDNKTGVCYEQLNYLEQVLAGRHVDDSYFGINYTIDKDDDWTTEAAARKANPNYGVSVFPDDMMALCKQAQANPQSQNAYLNKRLNVWTSVGAAYFNMLAWQNLCKSPGITMEALRGVPCMVTIDLASKSDLTALLTVFLHHGMYIVFGKYYLPIDCIEPGNPNYDFYRGWRERKLLTLTDGNATDYAFIERDLLEMMPVYQPARVGVDPNYNAGQFMIRMQEAGVPIEPVSHNVATFSEPMKELAAMIISGRIKHNGDPILEWNMANVMAKEDVKGNVYPRKASNQNKIDAGVALIANMSLQMRRPADGPSVYETRDMRFLG